VNGYLLLMLVLAIAVWWEWKFGLGWTVRAFRRWRGRQ
jgi:hypothetical protein